MDSVSYVVHLIDGPDPKHPFKHFATREGAREVATEAINSQSALRADIYEVPVAETRAAMAALKMGEGRLVDSKGQRATERERQEAERLLRNVISEEIFLPDWKP